MNILKNKISQMVLVGFLFALIGGVSSVFVHDVLKKSDYEKQIVIVDVANSNPLLTGIAAMNVSQTFGDKIVTISQELSNSINYSIVRYQRDPRVRGCHLIRMTFTDNSIFLETNNYPLADREKMNKCLDNLFSLSFSRLKKKLDINTSQEITKIRFVVEDLNVRSEKVKQQYMENRTSASAVKSQNLIDQICRQIENVYTDVLEEIKVFSQDGLLEEDTSNQSRSKNLVSIFNLFQNVFTFNTLAKECDVVDIMIINQEIEKLIKSETNLKKAKNILLAAKFEDVFKIEKLNIITSQPDTYLSKRNIIITFSLLGFVFGILLMYNFRFLNNEK